MVWNFQQTRKQTVDRGSEEKKILWNIGQECWAMPVQGVVGPKTFTLSERLDSASSVSVVRLSVFWRHALFTRPASTFFQENNFKTRFYGTIHIFKNYFATVFLVFNFQQ